MRIRGFGCLLAVAVVGLAVAGCRSPQARSTAQEQRRQVEAEQTYQAVEQGTPLVGEDVKALAKAGVSDELIISQIRSTRMVYRLGTAEIIDLKNAGVSEKVIDFMITTPSSTLTNGFMK